MVSQKAPGYVLSSMGVSFNFKLVNVTSVISFTDYRLRRTSVKFYFRFYIVNVGP